MAALDFPSSPSNGQQYVGPGGVTWVYDLAGTKWVAATLAGGVFAPLVSPALQGNPTSVTPSLGDADTSIATTSFVMAAVPNENYAHNTGFTINQRTYVSGTALAVGVFGHDRWKGGAGGGTYTFAAPSGPANTITITAGTLQQVIDGLGIAGGNYVLSWTGTAQGRVGAGSYAASPVSVTSIAAGANTTIEFNTGTLGRVKFEAGTVATPWQALDPVTQLQQCQRFYCTGSIQSITYGGAASGYSASVPFPVTMRTGAIANITGTPTLVNMPSVVVQGANADRVIFQGTATATGATGFILSYTASADL